MDWENSLEIIYGLCSKTLEGTASIFSIFASEKEVCKFYKNIQDSYRQVRLTFDFVC